MNNMDKNVHELEEQIESLKKELAMLKHEIHADVSIVVAVTDNEEALKDCLDILLMQSLISIEIICIYSGSSERIINMLRRYSAADNRIIVYYVTDKGMDRIFQYGIRFSGSEYITFLSVNCWYADENVLEALYKTARENGAYACGGDSRVFGAKATEKNTPEGFCKYRDLGSDEILSCYLFKKSEIAAKVNELPELLYYYAKPFTMTLLNETDRIYKINRTVCVRRALKESEAEDIYLCAELENNISELTLRSVADHLNSAEYSLAYAEKNLLERDYSDVYKNLLQKEQLLAVGEFYRAENPQIVKSVKRINDMMDITVLEKEDVYSYENMYHIALFETIRGAGS